MMMIIVIPMIMTMITIPVTRTTTTMTTTMIMMMIMMMMMMVMTMMMIMMMMVMMMMIVMSETITKMMKMMMLSAWMGGRFWTGFHDPLGQGQYKHYHSGRPIPVDAAWGTGEPNNPLEEHCVLNGNLIFWTYPCNRDHIPRVCKYIPRYWLQGTIIGL